MGRQNEDPMTKFRLLTMLSTAVTVWASNADISEGMFSADWFQVPPVPSISGDQSF